MRSQVAAYYIVGNGRKRTYSNAIRRGYWEPDLTSAVL